MMFAAGSVRRSPTLRPLSSAAFGKVSSRAGSSLGVGTFVSGSSAGRALSPRASSVPSLWCGSEASAVRASVRCIGP